MAVEGWHFVGDKLLDGRPVPPDGEVLVHKGPLEMCHSGLHFSERVRDALMYAAGNTVCRVRCSGEIVMGLDKGVCRERTILYRVGLEQGLRSFARWCALQVIHLWRAPDCVKNYLCTGTKRDAARAAATATAPAAATYTACYAARHAARAAARHASCFAAFIFISWDAAWFAARHAAWAAARAAGRAAATAAAAQEKKLLEIIEQARSGQTEWVFDIPETEEKES